MFDQTRKDDLLWRDLLRRVAQELIGASHSPSLAERICWASRPGVFTKKKTFDSHDQGMHNNQVNVAKATVAALKQLRSRLEVDALRKG